MNIFITRLARPLSAILQAGHGGGSAKPASGYDKKTLAQDIPALVEFLNRPRH